MSNSVLKDKDENILNPKIPRYEKFQKKFESGEILTNQMTNGQIGGINSSYYDLIFENEYDTIPIIETQTKTTTTNLGFVQTLISNLTNKGCRIWLNVQLNNSDYSVLYFVYED